MNQIEKNSVSSKNQLNGNGLVTFFNNNGNGKRVLFAGNSITRHGYAPQIGWNNDWGMAASDIEKDYVHILIKNIRQTDSDAAFCIAQVADWEREYLNGETVLDKYTDASDFGADIIIMRMIENCPYDKFDSEKFIEEYKKLMQFLDKRKKAKFIITTGFWKHTGDDAVRQVAKETGYPLVELGDLGEMDEMKAIGLFEHEGVANHPGDRGMAKIAERIFRYL